MHCATHNLTLDVVPLRRINFVAKRVQRLSFSGELNSRDRFEDRALPGGLITANDELGQWDVVTDTLGSKEIDHVKQLAVVFGLQRWKHFDVPTTAHSFCPSE